MSTRDLNVTKELDNKIESGEMMIGGLQLEFDMKEDWWVPKEYITKDSGERKQFSTGMVRDTSTDKPRYDLIYLPLLKRWAELMGRGAIKYGDRNWEKASTQEELNRFKESAFRHFMQWIMEENQEEDHAAAVLFNIAGAEFVKTKAKV